MQYRLTMALAALLAVLTLSLGLMVPATQAQDLGEAALSKAAAEVEGAIKGAMSRAGQEGSPTMQQLGGVQAGSTDSDASGGAGGDGSSGGGPSGPSGSGPST